MRAASSNAQSAFALGDYSGVLELSLDKRKSTSFKNNRQGFSLVIGSLCFLGRVSEAEVLYSKEKKQLSRKQIIEVRFFLGLGMTRDSKYTLGSRYFAANLGELRHNLSAEERFYVFQGASFYRYFSGKFKLALRGAQRAFEEALKSDLLYGRVLSADLKGHLLIQTGNVHSGLKTLREARRLAGILGNQAMTLAIDISIVLYESMHGFHPSMAIATLTKLLQTNPVIQDTYSRAGLLLELARQLILRGSFAKAAKTLDQAGELVYLSQNRRQEVALHLRYAYLSHLRGDDARGLSFVRSSKRGLVPEVDQAPRISVLGVEHLLVKSLNISDVQASAESELRSATLFSGGAISRRMLARSERKEELNSLSRGDALGDLKDSMAHTPANAVSEIIKNGYLSFLYELMPFSRGSQVICLGLQEGSVTIFDREKMEHSTGLTPLSRAFLLQLAAENASVKTKEELIKKVWKYPSYHPLRHDPVIYQAVMTLRKLLGSHAHWIVTTESGYSLLPSVFLQTAKFKKDEVLAAPCIAPEVSTASLAMEGLNHRQIKILRKLKQSEFINVHDYKDLFGVSEITATRDLSSLNRQGLMLRVGQARATRYTLASGNFRKK